MKYRVLVDEGYEAVEAERCRVDLNGHLLLHGRGADWAVLEDGAAGIVRYGEIVAAYAPGQWKQVSAEGVVEPPPSIDSAA